ncbi:MAG: HEAT repeat domain-containing protein [Sandaracinaceae bacterium]
MKDFLERFGSDDAEVRRRAVTEIAERNPEKRAELVTRALGDGDWRVRKEAVRVAAEVAESWGLLPDLVDALCQGENVGLRNAALEVLERLGPRSANALLVALPRVPSGARKFLVAALGFAGGAGVDRLAQLATDEDANTAQAAIEALARIGGPRAEEALRARLGSPEPVQRLAALEGLERLGASVPVSALQPLLGDRLMRRLVLGLLGYSHDAAAADALVQALEDPSSSTNQEAIRAIGKLLARGGAPAERLAGLAGALSADAQRTLRAMAGDGTAEELRRDSTWLLLLARDPEVASAAAELAADDRLPPEALAAIGAWGTAAISPFLHVANDLLPRARAAALEIATDLVAQGADPAQGEPLRAALRGALGSSDAALARAGARGMEVFAEAVDARPLVELAERVEVVGPVAGRALEALATRAPAAVAAALEEVRLDGPLGAALLGAVAVSGGASAYDRLAEALNAGDPRARRAALLALRKLGGQRAVELAGFALADEDIGVQSAAVMVLEQLHGVPRSVEQLRVAMNAAAEPVAAAAARALGRVGDRASLPALRAVVAEGRAGVGRAALEALRAMSDDALDEILVEALGSPDVELVKEALRAIAQSSAPRRGARIALALEHPAWDVRKLAASLLGELGGADVRSALLERAGREQDDGVQAAIELALSGSNEDEAG